MPKTTMVVTCGLVAVNGGRGGKVFFSQNGFLYLGYRAISMNYTRKESIGKTS